MLNPESATSTSPEHVIAATRLSALRPDGARRPIAISVGRPRDVEGAAACAVRMEGIDARSRDVYGEDTFQALALAVRYVHDRLDIEEERGVRFLLEGSEESFDWRRCWFSDHNDLAADAPGFRPGEGSPSA